MSATRHDRHHQRTILRIPPRPWITWLPVTAPSLVFHAATARSIHLHTLLSPRRACHPFSLPSIPSHPACSARVRVGHSTTIAILHRKTKESGTDQFIIDQCYMKTRLLYAQGGSWEAQKVIISLLRLLVCRLTKRPDQTGWPIGATQMGDPSLTPQVWLVGRIRGGICGVQSEVDRVEGAKYEV